MKIVKKLIIVSLLILFSLGVLTACNTVRLHEPVDLRIDHDTKMLTWTADPSSGSFRLDINGKRYSAKREEFSYFDLEPDKYTVKVRSISRSRYYTDSTWSEPIEFEVDADYGFLYTLINDNTAYQITSVTRSATDVVVPDNYRGLPVISIGAAAFSSSRITSIAIGSNVRTIGNRAFYNTFDLRSVVVPNTVTSIGDYAFQGAKEMTSITLPENMTTIPEGLLSYCSALTSIALPPNITSIGKQAFSRCKGLTKITIPDSVTSIGESAFADCDGLTEVKLGSSLKSIAKLAFTGVKELSSITIPSSVTLIGNSAFSLCDKLSQVKFEVGSEGLKIDDYAFKTALSMNSIDLPDRLQQLSGTAFNESLMWESVSDGELVYADNWLIGFKGNDRTSVTRLEIREGTVGIADYSLQKLTKLNNVQFPNSLKHIGMLVFIGCDSLTSAILHEGVLTLGDYAFAGSALTSITIPSSLTAIGMYAFNSTPLAKTAKDLVYVGSLSVGFWVVGYSDKSMLAVEIREGTKGIANYAFFSQEAMLNVFIPSTVTSIGDGAFYGCTSLLSVTVPSSVVSIGSYAFYECTDLVSLNLNEGLVSIGTAAFYGCTALLNVELPDTVVELGRLAFYNCENLVSVKLSQSMRVIAEYTFFRNTNLTSVGLPSGLEVLEQYAFYGCTVLVDINLANSITKIGDYAFYECNNLANISIPTSLVYLGEYAFFNCQKITTLSIPSGVKHIGARAFFNCVGVESLTISEGVESVGSYAFYNLGLITSLVIPSTITTIESHAFYRCAGLKSVLLTGNVGVINNHAFYGCNDLSIYTEHATRPSGWSLRWNSSNRPVIFGVELSADKKQVVSLTISKNSIQNPNAPNGISALEQNGQAAIGWSLTQAGTLEYTSDQLASVPEGTKLYPQWEE